MLRAVALRLESGAITSTSTPSSSRSARRAACRPGAVIPSSLVSRTRTPSILGVAAPIFWTRVQAPRDHALRPAGPVAGVGCPPGAAICSGQRDGIGGRDEASPSADSAQAERHPAPPAGETAWVYARHTARRVASVRLDIEYNGSGFSGWAKQPELRTVQGELESALATVLREPVQLTVAGRTDTGVHAWGQVASFATKAEIPADLARRLNGIGPRDIAVTSAFVADGSFDARRDARLAPTAIESWHARRPAPSSRVAPSGGRIGSTATPSTPARRRWPGRTTSPPSPRPRPTTSASSGTSSPPSGGGRATSSPFASPPTPSCATWSASWSAPCSKAPPAAAPWRALSSF